MNFPEEELDDRLRRFEIDDEDQLGVSGFQYCRGGNPRGRGRRPRDFEDFETSIEGYSIVNLPLHAGACRGGPGFSVVAQRRTLRGGTGVQFGRETNVTTPFTNCGSIGALFGIVNGTIFRLGR